MARSVDLTERQAATLASLARAAAVGEEASTDLLSLLEKASAGAGTCLLRDGEIAVGECLTDEQMILMEGAFVEGGEGEEEIASAHDRARDAFEALRAARKEAA